MSNNLASKALLASSFGKAASRYDAAAHLQREVGNHLIELLNTHCSKPVSIAMDLGCGTGYFARSLCERFQPRRLLMADISPEMLSFAEQRILRSELNSNLESPPEFLEIDAEKIPPSINSLGLIYSNLALQWANSLAAALSGCERSLAPGGVLAFSTLLDTTLHELKTSWASVDENQHVNSFLSMAQNKAAIQACGLEVLAAEQAIIELEYESALGLMRDLKAIGAHNISTRRTKGLTGKRALQQMLEAYEQFRRSDGLLPATYKVGYFLLKKRDI